jgi:hypothetical protein
MNLSDARIIADKYLAQMQADSTEVLAFNYDITEVNAIGFIFFYNTKRYWETGDFMTSLAGNGPILVRRQDGNIVELPADRTVEASIRDIQGYRDIP